MNIFNVLYILITLRFMFLRFPALRRWRELHDVALDERPVLHLLRMKKS